MGFLKSFERDVDSFRDGFAVVMFLTHGDFVIVLIIIGGCGFDTVCVYWE